MKQTKDARYGYFRILASFFSADSVFSPPVPSERLPEEVRKDCFVFCPAGRC